MKTSDGDRLLAGCEPSRARPPAKGKEVAEGMSDSNGLLAGFASQQALTVFVIQVRELATSGSAGQQLACSEDLLAQFEPAESLN